MAAVYRAPLGGADFSILLARARQLQDEIAALAQQHYGTGLEARNLPGSWSSTGNALEAVAFAAKDALFVVDDSAPTGTTADTQRSHREADRLLRAQGNHAGRLRNAADSTLRPSKPPRGLILSTGEDVPRGQSLRSRMFVVEVSAGDVRTDRLTECQRDAGAGSVRAGTFGISPMARARFGDISGGLRHEAAELRDKARTEGQHARTPGIAADLALGLRYLLAFAREAGAVTEQEAALLWERGWSALLSVAGEQAAHVAAAEPAAVFLRLFWAAVASGAAHVADKDGNAPPNPQSWGWRPEEFHTGSGTDSRLKPQGRCVGWLADGELFLEPDASFAAVQRFAQEQGDGFAVTSNTLRRRLKEKNLLATVDADRGKLTVRKTLQGSRRDVLHIAWAGRPSPPPTGPTGPRNESDAENGPHSWA